MAAEVLLRVPIQDGGIVDIDHLPDDVQDLLQFLESEAVPLSYWWDLARAYLAAGRRDEYVSVLTSALDEELLKAVEEFFKARPTFDIAQLHCGLAAHHIEAARAAAGAAAGAEQRAARQQHLAEAQGRVAAAKAEAPDEQLPYLAAGCLALAKGDAAAALQEFKLASRKRHNGRPNASGLLGMAAAHFGAGRYAEALEL